MAVIGHLKGKLTLTFPDAEPLTLGTISLPLKAVNAPRANSGADEISISIVADLEELRSTIQQLFTDQKGTQK